MMPTPATYNFLQTYQENCDRPDVLLPPAPRDGLCSFELLGLPLRSRLGIFSGPLLNSRWILQYARLGWDVLVYKTVRSRFQAAHPAPNCALITETQPLALEADRRPRHLFGTMAWENAHRECVSMTNSFGMPSQRPEHWMSDVRRARDGLVNGQILLVSVVGETLNDYVRTAGMAREAGAHGVELNLSCPNVCGREGSLFLDPEGSGELCSKVAAVLGDTPLIVKLGYLEEQDRLERLLAQVEPFVRGVSGINTVPMEVRNSQGHPMLGAERLRAGICGDIIRQCGLHFASRVADWRDKHRAGFKLLAGGGIMLPEHIDQYLSAGADVAMMATAVMINPELAVQYREELKVFQAKKA